MNSINTPFSVSLSYN